MPSSIPSDMIAKALGYALKTANFKPTSENLPIRVNVLGESNTANQGALSLEPVEITSAKQAGQLFGYGSPLHMMMRILFPVNGLGVGTIPVWVYPQAAAVGATSKILKLVITGTATGNGTHKIKIAGRDGVDGMNYNLPIVSGDSAAVINAKIDDIINAVLGSPMTCIDYGYETRHESKWKGLTANDLNITVDTDGKPLGLTYTVTQIQAASGTPSIDPALNKFGNIWAPLVLNGIGAVSAALTSLEQYNGIADNQNPTGRFVGTIFKPFVAVSGSIAEDPSSITDSRKDQMTNAIAPAPLSPGMPFEAAANMMVILARQTQNNPELDASGNFYPDMPVPTSIGAMSDLVNRNAMVLKGCSTADLVDEKYRVEDFVTTYHPDGEVPPQFRYVRSLIIDFNTGYTIKILNELFVIDHVICKDDDIVDAPKVIKPKQLKQILSNEALKFVRRGLHTDAAFMQASITVLLDGGNPDRINSTFNYKRSSYGRQVSTDGTAGFNFGGTN